jgi:hypothetical protein
VLRKGEMAVSVRKKNESIRRSVAARLSMLKLSLSAPNTAKQKFISACEAQTKLAALEMPELDIYPLSLNSMKAAADAEPDGGGWKKFDELRKEVVLKFGIRSASHVPIRGLSQRRRDTIVDLTGQLEQAHLARSVLGQAYLDLLNELQRVSKTDEVIASKLRRHLQKYEKISGLHLVDVNKK